MLISTVLFPGGQHGIWKSYKVSSLLRICVKKKATVNPQQWNYCFLYYGQQCPQVRATSLYNSSRGPDNLLTVFWYFELLTLPALHQSNDRIILKSLLLPEGACTVEYKILSQVVYINECHDMCHCFEAANHSHSNIWCLGRKKNGGEKRTRLRDRRQCLVQIPSLH